MGRNGNIEVAEDTEAQSTDTDVEEAKYLSERVHGAERSTRRAMWPHKGRVTSTGMIDEEVRRMTVPNQRSQREESETWIGRIWWRQRLGEHRQVWWIGRSRRFETIRWRWWTGRRRWFAWKGWSCSKWKTKSGKSTRRLRTRLVTLAENLAFFPLCLAHTGGCAVRWGQMS